MRARIRSREEISILTALFARHPPLRRSWHDYLFLHVIEHISLENVL